MTDQQHKPRGIGRRAAIRQAALGGAALSAPLVWTGRRAFGADQITAADMGGAPAAAIRKAFYDPFEKETGIKVAGVVHESDPTTQFKLLVDAKSYIWDVCTGTPANEDYLRRPKEYLEPLNIAASDAPGIIPGMLTPTWFGFSVFCTIIAYREDKFPGGKGPSTWAEFWDVKKFPGRRGLYKGVSGMLEGALMADGVPATKLYPLDLDRAFRMLDKIKPFINVWWTSGAQNTQLLQSGEVAMTDTWGARAYAAIEGGAPVKMVWTEGLYSADGWMIPKGSPRADLARKFIRFCMKPEQQAIYSNTVANAPTNAEAYKFITPDRAKLLATAPDNIKGLVPTDAVWWSTNRDIVQERFQDWLLG